MTYEFQECAACAADPDRLDLCPSCVNNRAAIAGLTAEAMNPMKDKLTERDIDAINRWLECASPGDTINLQGLSMIRLEADQVSSGAVSMNHSTGYTPIDLTATEVTQRREEYLRVRRHLVGLLRPLSETIRTEPRHDHQLDDVAARNIANAFKT